VGVDDDSLEYLEIVQQARIDVAECDLPFEVGFGNELWSTQDDKKLTSFVCKRPVVQLAEEGTERGFIQLDNELDERRYCLSLGLPMLVKSPRSSLNNLTSLLGVAIPSTLNPWRKMLNNGRMFS
jgi:hypothetical protein